MNTNHFNYVA